MKNNEKRMILVIILIGIVIIAGLLLWRNKGKNAEQQQEEETKKEEYVQELEDGTKLNISNKLKEEKTINGLKIGNIQLTEKNGQSILLADVKNDTSKDSETFLINIILLDSEGEEIAKIPGIISSIKAGETEQLNAGITDNYANAYDFKVEKR